MQPSAHPHRLTPYDLVAAMMRGLMATWPAPAGRPYPDTVYTLANAPSDLAPDPQPTASLMPRPHRAIAARDTVSLPEGRSSRLQHWSTAELLALACRLAANDAGPEQLLRELTALGLPISPLEPDRAGVVSVTGNSTKGWNEDTALGFRSQHHLMGPEGTMLMVFDGMGGLKDGQLASKFAALAMAVELHRTPDTLTNDLGVHLAAAFERVNRRFRAAARLRYGHLDPNVLRTTAIVLLADEAHYVLGHQGDGQAVVRRADGCIEPLMQAHKGAASNLISRSLGPMPDGEADVHRHDRRPGDLVAIVTDGFDQVPPEQMLEVLHFYSRQQPLQEVAAGLTEECCRQQDHLGPITDDNMSLAVLRTDAAGSADPAHLTEEAP